MSVDPLVSIIIPSYNHAQYIDCAVNSALSQTYKNIEVIVVDDGSTDDTHEVLRLAFGRDARVRLVLNKENRGQSAVMNQGLAISRGSFVQQLSSDDWLLPEKISLQVKKFQESGPKVGVIYGRGSRYLEDTEELVPVNLPMFRGDVLKQLAEKGNFIFPMSPLFRREVFDKVPFDESYTAQGEAIYVYISIHYHFDYVEQTVAVMRDHKYNTGKQANLLYEEVRRYWEDFFSNPSVPLEIKKYKKARMRKLHRTKGLQFIGDHYDFKRGRHCLINALKCDPCLVLDFHVLFGILLTFLPESVAKKILSYR